MRPTQSLLVTALVTSIAASAVAQDKAPAASGGPRKDPKGITGISPFWEALKKGDDAFVTRDFDGAIARYREALGAEPNNALGHYRLGEAQLSKGDMKEARASWETAKRFANDATLRAKVLMVLADLSERERALDEANNGWIAYEGNAQAAPSAKSYPETAADRKRRIATWKQLEVDYSAVKERIKKRLEEATKP